MLVVSTPEFGPDQRGGFTDPVMEKLKALSRAVPHVSIAYDWKDSTNAFEGDKAKWDELFRLPDGPVSRWKEGRGAERMVALDDMVKGVKATQWWARYTGQIKGGVKVEC